MGNPYRARRWAESGSRGAYEAGSFEPLPAGVVAAVPVERPAGLDEDATVDEVRRWVAGDRDRAAAVLAWERSRPEPRSTLIRRLRGFVES